MNVVIIEDEKLAAERLAEMLTEIDSSIHIIARLTSVAEAVEWLKNHSADLLFVDIQLSDGLGFSIFEQVSVDTPIIFTTAYDEYAVKAFQLNSVHYLLKPIRKSELEQSLAKFKRLRQPSQPDIESLLKALKGETVEYKKRFLIQFGEQIENIHTKNIAYFYAMEKSTFLTTFDRQTYPLDLSLDKIVPQLDPELFFRINRKMIINLGAIKKMIAFSRSRVKIDLQPPAPRGIDPVVSVERSADFKRWLDQ